ncbi:hypothetical protein BDV19DRAFT_398823 [Aspergillus venezuelensis]
MVSALLRLLARIAPASAFRLPFVDQSPLPIENANSNSTFVCDLPPILDPAGDGLPSVASLFSSDEALKRQVKRHQAIVRMPSVSYNDLGEIGEDLRWEPFYQLYPVLKKTYPKLHKRATIEKINTFGLLYTFEGSDPSLKPTLLMAHQDLVPVADASTWTYPPFDAYFDGEYIWDRGASDDKNILTGILSAVEGLLSESSWKPRRTLLLALGFDEEVGLDQGAKRTADVLQERYGDDSVAVILDEGGLGSTPLDDDTVYIHPAITERGIIDIFFELHVKGGHSSVPPPHTGIGIVSEIVTALEANPYKPVIVKDSPIHKRLICQTRYSPGAQPKIEDLLLSENFEALAEEFARTNPLNRFVVQTSQAVDLISGGVKINVMPEVSPLDVQHKAVQVIADVVEKYGLKVEAYKGDKEYEDYVAEPQSSEYFSRSDIKRRGTDLDADNVDYGGTLVVSAPHKSKHAPVSPADGKVWEIFSGTIQHSYGSEEKTVIPVGDTSTGNTDTRYYLSLSRNVYRWTPAIGRDSNNIHTMDERIK